MHGLVLDKSSYDVEFVIAPGTPLGEHLAQTSLHGDVGLCRHSDHGLALEVSKRPRHVDPMVLGRYRLQPLQPKLAFAEHLTHLQRMNLS